MKCSTCGFESSEQFTYCPHCGDGPQAAALSQNPAATAVLAALKDNLFLVLCILMSASCVLTIANDGLPLLAILSTVFLWLTFAQSRKDIADPKQLRNVSGTVYAQYVINNVLAVILLVCGVILSAAMDVLMGDPEFTDILMESLAGMGADFAGLAGLLTAASAVIFAVVFILIAILIAVINIFSIRYIHRFAKSVYQSIDNGVLELKHVGATRGWLIAFAVCSGISALSSASTSLIASLANATDTVVCILAVILINKYLVPEE